MDPQTAYQYWLNAEAPAESRDYREAYNGWVARGGFRATVCLGDRAYQVVRLVGQETAVLAGQGGETRWYRFQLI